MKDLSPLLNPRTIAVVGASEKASARSFVMENIRPLAYRQVLPVLDQAGDSSVNFRMRGAEC
jgi:predicted CoA-binding protein